MERHACHHIGSVLSFVLSEATALYFNCCREYTLFCRFLATGSFYTIVGDAHGPSRATIHRTGHRVLAAIIRRLLGLIGFPRSREACRAVQRRFFDMAGLPDVIGKLAYVSIIGRTFYSRAIQKADTTANLPPRPPASLYPAAAPRPASRPATQPRGLRQGRR